MQEIPCQREKTMNNDWPMNVCSCWMPKRHSIVAYWFRFFFALVLSLALVESESSCRPRDLFKSVAFHIPKCKARYNYSPCWLYCRILSSTADADWLMVLYAYWMHDSVAVDWNAVPSFRWLISSISLTQEGLVLVYSRVDTATCRRPPITIGHRSIFITFPFLT